MNNFAFEVKVILDLESTILDGRTERLGIEPATAQLKLGLGLSLAIKSLKNVLIPGTAEIDRNSSGDFLSLGVYCLHMFDNS